MWTGLRAGCLASDDAGAFLQLGDLTPWLDARVDIKLCSDDESRFAWARAYLVRAATKVRWPPKDGQPEQEVEVRHRRHRARKT